MNRVEWGKHTWWIKGETYITIPGEGEIQAFVVLDSSVHAVVRTDAGNFFDIPVKFIKQVFNSDKILDELVHHDQAIGRYDSKSGQGEGSQAGKVHKG